VTSADEISGSEGKADRQAGEVKEKVDEVIDKVKSVVHPKK
jgi:uncharacterized protein YjbJ (UPF0337 family)